MSRRNPDANYSVGRPMKLSKFAAQNNAIAEQMRREAAKREASQQPAPVTIKAKEPA